MILSASQIDFTQSPLTGEWSRTFVPDYTAESYTQWGVTCHSAFAEKTYRTSATSVTVETYCEYPVESGKYFSVWINGQWNQNVAVGDGSDSTTVTLPPGPKAVTLVNGLQNKPSTTIQGVQILSAVFNRNQSLVRKTPTLAILGDSNAVGAGTSNSWRYSWPLRLRARGYAVSVDAWGYRAVVNEVQNVTQHGSTKILVALGTNDRWLSLTSAAQLQTNYTALLDAIEAVFDGTIYALVPPDITGIDMSTYQAAVTAAASGRATVLSSHEWDRSDSVHLSDAGSLALADYVEAQCLS